jgi:glyoxylase I family protein
MRAMTINTASVHHVRLTVTDIARSRTFYDNVFGWPVVMQVPADADAETREKLSFLYDGVIYGTGDMLVGLRPVAQDRFDENRVGLDHLAFQVSTKADLDAAADHLDHLGIAHEPIKDIGTSHILEFRDPDNIALELIALT